MVKCWYTNATSLNNKLHELALLSVAYDILFVTETWFNDNSSSNVNGFSTYRRDRTTPCGGVCIYISNRFMHRPAPDMTGMCSEQIWCEIVFGSQVFLLGCIYRPPKFDKSAGTLAAASEIVATITKANALKESGRIAGLLICGDFNYSSIHWRNGSGSTNLNEKSMESAFTNCLFDCALHQLIDSPTYNADSSSGSILDLVLTDDADRVDAISVGPPLGKIASGHVTLTWKYAVGTECVSRQFNSIGYNFSKGDYDGFSSFISSHNWSEVLGGLNADEALTAFMSIYQSACNTYIPLRRHGNQRERQQPWCNAEIKQLLRRKKRQHYGLMASGKRVIDSNKKEFAKTCRKLKKAIKAAVAKYELSRMSTSHKDRTWYSRTY